MRILCAPLLWCVQCTAVLHLPCKASFFLWLRQGLTSVPLVLRLSSAVPRLCQLLTFCYCRLLNAVTRVVFYPNGRLTMTFSKPFYHMQRADYYENHEGARHCRKPLGRRSVTKGPIYKFFELVTTAAFDCTKIQNTKLRIELSTFLGNGNNANIFPRISGLRSAFLGLRFMLLACQIFK